MSTPWEYRFHVQKKSNLAPCLDKKFLFLWLSCMGTMQRPAAFQNCALKCIKLDSFKKEIEFWRFILGLTVSLKVCLGTLLSLVDPHPYIALPHHQSENLKLLLLPFLWIFFSLWRRFLKNLQISWPFLPALNSPSHARSNNISCFVQEPKAVRSSTSLQWARYKYCKAVQEPKGQSVTIISTGYLRCKCAYRWHLQNLLGCFTEIINILPPIDI